MLPKLIEGLVDIVNKRYSDDVLFVLRRLVWRVPGVHFQTTAMVFLYVSVLNIDSSVETLNGYAKTLVQMDGSHINGHKCEVIYLLKTVLSLVALRTLKQHAASLTLLNLIVLQLCSASVYRDPNTICYLPRIV